MSIILSWTFYLEFELETSQLYELIMMKIIISSKIKKKMAHCLYNSQSLIWEIYTYSFHVRFIFKRVEPSISSNKRIMFKKNIKSDHR